MVFTRDRRNEHSVRMADAARCPELQGNATQRAQRASAEATDFVLAVREEEPRVVWGRISRLMEEHPERLMAAVVHLAAMVNPDEPIASWTRDFGGMAALHPDYLPRPKLEPPTEKPRPKTTGCAVSKYADAVKELASTTNLSDDEIAAKVGCSTKTVSKYRTELGIYRPMGPNLGRTDARVRPLIERGLTNAEIMAETGFAKSTVRYARQRIEAEQRQTEDGTAA